jgi:hypothetical protein
VDQYGTGDALQVKDGGVTKFLVNTNGITTLSGGVISNSGDGTINRNLLSEIPASNMYLQLYKTGNRSSNTGPSIVFGGSYYPTEDFGNAYAAIKGISTPYIPSSIDSLGGMLKFYVNDGTAGTASLNETDCKMVIDQYGNVGIGTTNPTAKLHINGDIRVSTAYYVTFYGIPSIYNSSKVLRSYPTSVAEYIYLKWPNNVHFNFNPVTYINNTYRISVPVNGMYFIKLTIVGGSSDCTPFISKNIDNNETTLNTGDDKLIATAFGSNTTLSGVTYLTITDFIVLGFFNGSAGANLSARTTSHIYCIQQM